MNWSKHYNLKGRHAFLSASKYNWINYDDERLVASYNAFTAAAKGTELHEFAARCIELNQKLSDEQLTLNMYVNDSIAFGMTSEQILYYSDNCFGTADAISFDNNILRINDLKTGTMPANMSQLKVYAALFCLEYDYYPDEIEIELRIYQGNDVIFEKAGSDEIVHIMETIAHFDRIINCIK